MLLSIDRVLQLLSEGKPIEKIAELAGCDSGDVVSVITEARGLLHKYDKSLSKKKIIIHKKKPGQFDNEAELHESSSGKDDFLLGAELSAVPLSSTLTIYTDGASKGNPGPAGIGIVIYDMDDRQVGKVSASIGSTTNNVAEYKAIIRAIKIANYFQAREVKIRTDSELIVKQISGEYQVRNENIKPLYKQVVSLMKKIPKIRIEHVTRNLNDKADYLAKKGSESSKRAR